MESLAASCRFCGHGNPGGAKFCNDCGSPLHLRPCAFCQAINDADAARCHVCDAALALPDTPVAAEPPPAAAGSIAQAPEVAASRVPSPRIARALIVLLAVVAAPSAYYVYRQARDHEPPRPALPRGTPVEGIAPSPVSAAGERGADVPPPRPVVDAAPAPMLLPATAGTAWTLWTEPMHSSMPADGGFRHADPWRDGVPGAPGIAAESRDSPTTNAALAAPSATKRTTGAQSSAKSRAKSPGAGRTPGAKSKAKKNRKASSPGAKRTPAARSSAKP